MPQMMPLNWMTLFTFFSIMLILFNVLNYYMPYNKSTSLPLTKVIIKTLTWKW
uniref:ATP synthase complex subunit 8 n=1 Tax=Creobroter jiangxiensis TaxID=2073089 RepID=A0A343UN76_9NEOP|nr:ATP synthase F0 subunit 8 [Creobroter jiangxiensis]AVE15726.1 ATP synthase F0 subunit 8 [Creobroter jiangxiensis]